MLLKLASRILEVVQLRYLILTGSGSSFFTTMIFRKAFRCDQSPDSFTHLWKLAVSSPIGGSAAH